MSVYAFRDFVNAAGVIYTPSDFETEYAEDRNAIKATIGGGWTDPITGTVYRYSTDTLSLLIGSVERIDGNGNAAFRDVLPDADVSYDLGSSGLRWATVYAGAFAGSGASLTGLDADELGSGTIPDARFPAVLPALDGSALTDVDAATLLAGTWASPGAALGSGTPQPVTGTTVTASTGDVTASAGDVVAATAGKGLKVKEGSNARMGVGTLVAGTVTISTIAVTATSRVQITVYDLNGSTAIGRVEVGTVTAATSFVVNARKADATIETNDVSKFAWLIVEPA